MKDKFKFNLNAFLTEQQENSLLKLREDNAAYNDLRAAHAKASQKFSAILGTLSPEDKLFAGNYVDEIYQIGGMECEQVYLQGYKDCIRLLCIFDVLEVKL